MKKLFAVILIPFFGGCISIKVLELNAFKISIPSDWKYIKQQGIDSFIGMLQAGNDTLHFDFSMNGYANSLISTEQEYIKREEWKRGPYFLKPDITYTAEFDVKPERERQMKKLGTTDSTKVHVEADPSYKTKSEVSLPTTDQKLKYPKADYIAKLTYKDSSIFVAIEIPPEIKMHNIQIDSTDSYIIKTISPKVPGKGDDRNLFPWTFIKPYF
ncbi:hypothetical protein [Mucilaginibacter celer]|uniref:Lipoprotein n=1 Tax=Mucilaginibacter celer TaxID=2305508 RepID=A0A494VUS1_9SPHI|nr:hypothetical protein [Mucilaginibacter celer]AYL94732.1 hypothetical protein HYN43_005220 [Mucilaginibacter celer]